MKKMVLLELILVILEFIMAVFVSFYLIPSEDPQPGRSLKNLPAEKELMFQQAMSTRWERTKDIREQIKGLEQQVKAILASPEFNPGLYLEKTRNLQELRRILINSKDEVIAKLGSQFTQEERKILVEVLFKEQEQPLGPEGR